LARWRWCWHSYEFSVNHMDVEQDVELRWLSGITNAAELLRIATLEVGASITLQSDEVRASAMAAL
jgi:hypothetical protein